MCVTLYLVSGRQMTSRFTFRTRRMWSRRMTQSRARHRALLELPGTGTGKAMPPWAECALGSSTRTVGANVCPPWTDWALGLALGFA